MSPKHSHPTQPFAFLHGLLPLPLVCGTLLGTLAAAPSVHAQTAVTTWAQSYGTASYDVNGQPSDTGTGADLPYGIAPMPDGGVVVAGQLGLFTYVTDPGAYGAGIVRYDSNGAILWQTLLRQDNDYTDYLGTYYAQPSNVIGVRTDAAGNIFVAGGLGAGTGNPGGGGAFVTRFAPDGTLVWQADATTLNFEVVGQGVVAPGTYPGSILPATTMDLTDDGGVIIGTAVEDQSTGYGLDGHSVPILIKINADGSLGFHREYENPNQYAGVISVCQRADGPGYAVLLEPTMDVEVNSGITVLVVLTDESGNPATQVGFSGGSGSFITRDASGGYFVGGSVPTSGYQSVGEVRKLRADLTPVWQKVLSLPPPYNNSLPIAYNMTPTSDGGCIVGGQVASASVGGTNNAPSALLLTLDGTGAIASAHVLGGSVAEGLPNGGGAGTFGTLPSSCLTTDGAIAFTCTTFSYATGTQKTPDWWVVKINANGQVPGYADTMYDAPASAFQDTDSTEAASVASSDYGPIPSEAPDAFALGGEPALVLENLATETGLNAITVKFQATPVTGTAHPAFFTGESSLGSGVYYLTFPSGNYFGYYSYLTDPAYIYHFDLGYEYVFDANDGNSGVYFYDFASNDFFYTSPGFPFPYLYDFGLNSTVYYYPDPNNAGHYNTDGIRYFYVFNTGQIISK